MEDHARLGLGKDLAHAVRVLDVGHARDDVGNLVLTQPLINLEQVVLGMVDQRQTRRREAADLPHEL